MVAGTELEEITLNVLTRMNERLPKGQKILCEPQTLLFGEEGMLDSIGIVNFIVAIEEELENSFGKSIALSDEDFTQLFEASSVSVRSFAMYLATCMKD